MHTLNSFLSRIFATGFVAAFFLFSLAYSLHATELIGDNLLIHVPAEQKKQKSEKETEIVALDEQVDKKHLEELPFTLLGESVEPGTLKQINWPVSLSSIKFNIPVIVAHGKMKGPVIGITAAVHGDELNGIEIARQVLHGVDPQRLAGTLVSVPIVNIEGFMKQSRYIADRRDLNRYFPGDPQGITPARFAHELFQRIILRCDALIDLHTGSYFRTNMPQLRGDLTNDAVALMVEKFGSLTVLHSPGVAGMLRNVATDAGIAAVTMEVGGPLSVDPKDVEFGVKAINTFLGELEMTGRARILRKPQPVFYKSQWLMADFSGIFLASVKLGDAVKQNQKIAMIVNPMTNEEYEVKAPFPGTVLGMAFNQFVSPGYMIFRIGIKKTEEELREEAEQEKHLPANSSTVDMDVIVDSEVEQVPNL